jgi:hypothetical protein
VNGGGRSAKVYWLTCRYCGWQPPLASPEAMRARIGEHIRDEHQQETAR